MIAAELQMTTPRTVLLNFSALGFAFSLGVHFFSLAGHTPSSDSWLVLPFLGALVSFSSAGYLSGAKTGRMGTVPICEIVKGSPKWLKWTVYFFSAYLGLVLVWLVVRSSEVFRWRKVEMPTRMAFVVFSAFAVLFYVSSFSMLFGKMFGVSPQPATSSSVTKETI